MATTPSTQWREKVAPDEAERYARYADAFAEIQRRKSERYGKGRTLHRKQLAAAQGTLEVLDGLREANSDEGNAVVEVRVRDKVRALTARFPIYAE